MYKKILRRAKMILEKGPLPESHNEHGDYCPYCAIALATDQLDDENLWGDTTSDLIQQMLRKRTVEDINLESDMPLLSAKKVLGIIEQPFTKEATLNAFSKVLLIK